MSYSPLPESDKTQALQGRKQIDALLAQAVRLQGDADRLFVMAGEALELSVTLGYDRGRAESNLLLARYHEQKENFPDALEACFNALSLYRGINDVAGQAQALRALTTLYASADEPAEALACADQGMDLLGGNDALLRLGLSGLFVQLLLLRADMLMRLGRHGEALAVFLEVLPSVQETGGEALVRLELSLCECHLMTGNTEAALEANERAMELAASLRLDSAELTAVHTLRAAVLEHSGDAPGAMAAYKDALNHAIHSRSKYAVTFTLTSIGRLQLSMEHVDAAKSTLNKALAIAWEMGSDELAREIHTRMALWYDKRDYLDSDKTPASGRTGDDSELRRRLRHIQAILPSPVLADDKEIFRQINEEIKRRIAEVYGLRHDLEEQARTVAVAADVSRALADTDTLPQIALRLAEELSRILSFDELAIGVCREGQKSVDYVAWWREGALLSPTRRAHPSEVLKAMRNGRDLIFTDIPPQEAARYALAQEEGDHQPRSALFCSFLCFGEPHVLTIHSRQAEAFDSGDLRLLRCAAQSTALAMASHVRLAELARREAALQQASYTDALTGLMTRHNLIDRMEEESIRSQRSKRPFALVLIEADQLKGLRDSFGQECFDALMKQLARLLRPSIRKQDFLARWSDDQFAILLPETGADGAAQLCEKLRKKAARTFSWQQNEHTLTLTCGLSEYSTARSLDAMHKAAESALLAAKLKGRDCVEKR